VRRGVSADAQIVSHVSMTSSALSHGDGLTVGAPSRRRCGCQEVIPPRALVVTHCALDHPALLPGSGSDERRADATGPRDPHDV
jgi:hypothetical protein